jgi:polyisoprenoid-binding protein YceI
MQVQTQKSPAPDNQTVWSFDHSHSTVEFTVKNFFFFTVKGQLAPPVGTIVFDEADIKHSSVAATIEASSIDTRNKQRDAHLRTADFLDARVYPEIQFESSSVRPGNDRDTLRVKGSLTIKGKSRPVELEVILLDRSRSPRGEEVIYYVATTQLDRFAFGINYCRGIIGRLLNVTINVQASRPL